MLARDHCLPPFGRSMPSGRWMVRPACRLAVLAAALLGPCALAGANNPPIIGAATLSPSSFTAVGSTQTFSVLADDYDGVIVRAVWKFGDGDQAFGLSGSRRVSQVGTYTATVYVVDNSNNVATRTVTWSVTDPAYPSLTVDAAAAETSTASVTLTGSASGASPAVVVSSNRNGNQVVAATGLAPWSAVVPLRRGPTA